MTAAAKSEPFRHASAAAPGAGLMLVSASAGSGKTSRLTEEVTRSVDPASVAPIDIQGLVGVTYTTKAQAELETRIRRVLVERSAFERAQELPLAYLGTVHAVCLRILKEFALDAGLSPAVDVIPGNEGRRLLQAALEHELDPALHGRLQERATEFQLGWDGRIGRIDWVTPVDDIMTLARGNRIAPADLPQMARRSVGELLALLPPADPPGSPLEAELRSSLAMAIEKLAQLDDNTKKTHEALRELRSSASKLAQGRLPWAAWAKLAKLSPGKRAQPLVATVQRAASAYERHPDFRAHLGELTELLFQAARAGLDAYAQWKQQRGLIDYVDMIDRALDVLDVPEVAAELRERLELVVVDEFQDTSPIQLALFMRLHALSGNSIWVGDRKQCIFEYAGADPALMEAVTDWAARSGGRRELLQHNYRSRPELVDWVSALFSAALAPHGYRPEEVATIAHRPPSRELATLAPIGLWWLEVDHANALAEGIGRLLQGPELTPVIDRATGAARNLRPSDIAVLVYSNAEAGQISKSLAARGIGTVLPRTGLLMTPEGTLVTSALRLLADRRDTLAAAEIDALTGFGVAERPADATVSNGEQPWELWLRERIRVHCARKSAEHSEAPREAPALERLRAELDVLSPAETLDRVLAVLDVASLAIRWPDPPQRLANLDALRALAVAYEERCAYQREAASLAGLLRYFQETQQIIRQRDEERATDEQHVGGSENAIVISTYHKAKGLEWPVVILGSLGRDRRRDAFEVAPETDRDSFDAARPLAGRWIRYWPWPLGQQQAVPLADRAASSPAGRAIAERDARERVRLLYVGCTRARDHLILAVPLLKKGPSTAWLDEIRDEGGPLLTLPELDAPKPELAMRGGGQRLSVPVRAWSLAGTQEVKAVPPAGAPRFWFAPVSAAPSEAPPYWISPSSAAQDTLNLPRARVLSSKRFTRRMPFASPKGTTWDQVGSALHAFLAADCFELGHEQRRDLASRVLRRAGLVESFSPEVAIAASDALRTFIAERWPGAAWHREIPISAVVESAHGRRRIAGAIDLLLETSNGFVIIDHKSFPGRAKEWEERALGYAPQLMTYAKAIEMAGGKVLGRFVYFTIGGGIVEIGEDG